MNTSVPSYSSSAAISESMLAMSRCVVGSSISSKFGGSSRSFTNASRLFSPPLNTLTRLNTSSPLKRNVPSMVRALFGQRLRTIRSLLQNSGRRVQYVHAVLGKITGLHVVPEIARASLGSSTPAISLSSVDLPAPLGPTTRCVDRAPPRIPCRCTQYCCRRQNPYP